MERLSFANSIRVIEEAASRSGTMTEIVARQAEQYRQKAEEVRATADITRDLVCRDALRRLADGYDRLAGNLDRVASRHPVEEKSTGT